MPEALQTWAGRQGWGAAAGPAARACRCSDNDESSLIFPSKFERISFNANSHMERLLVRKRLVLVLYLQGNSAAKRGGVPLKQLFPLSENINPAQSPGSLVPVFEAHLTEIQ